MHSQRLKIAAKILSQGKDKTDGMIILKAQNITWLSGFSGSFGWLILRPRGKHILISDGRYQIAAQQCAKKCEMDFWLYDENIGDKLAKLAGKFWIEDTMTIAQQAWIKKLCPKIQFKKTSNKIEQWRRKKDQQEIMSIAKAQKQVDKVLLVLLQQYLKAGMTEKQLAFQLELAIREQGKYDLSFPSIVAFGEHSAIPHHHPSDRKLHAGDNILIDCGASYQGYCSDMTRNFFYKKATPEQQSQYQELLTIQTESIKQYQAGKKIADLEKSVRKDMGTNAKYFTHSLGHGVGMEVHELPAISRKNKPHDSLQTDDVVTCEPGVYWEGKWGYRIEDLLVITSKGSPKILSKTTRELLIIR